MGSDGMGRWTIDARQLREALSKGDQKRGDVRLGAEAMNVRNE